MPEMFLLPISPSAIMRKSPKISGSLQAICTFLRQQLCLFIAIKPKYKSKYKNKAVMVFQVFHNVTICLSKMNKSVKTRLSCYISRHPKCKCFILSVCVLVGVNASSLCIRGWGCFYEFNYCCLLMGASHQWDKCCF